MSNSLPKNFINNLYWLTIIILLILQLIYIVNSNMQISYEELAESIRNVYWLSKGLIYDGVSSSVGWYGMLLVFYKIFGFSLHAAKIFRFLLAVAALISTAILLKKLLGAKLAFLPLITVGLSPTILYFTTLQAQFGIEFQYLPITILLLISLNFTRKRLVLIQQVLLWSIVMVAAMSYPTFLFYIPILVVIYIYQLHKNNLIKNTELLKKNIIISFSSFLLPLLIATVFIKNPNVLWYDTNLQSGIFRGAGKLNINLENFQRNITQLASDLFIKGDSYYYRIPQPDFSNIYPITPIFLSTFLLWKIRKTRNSWILKITLLSTFLNIFVVGFTLDPSNNPGVRRATPFLAVLYLFSIFGWKIANEINIKNKILKLLMIGTFLLLPLHHVLAYSPNLESLKEPSPYQYHLWFGIENTPSKSFSIFTNQALTQDLKLSCFNEENTPKQCRYNEIYPAVAGYCEWNALSCNRIYGYDESRQKYILLTPSLWANYYFEH